MTKNLFRKAENGLKKAFSKQAVNEGMNKINKAYLKSTPIAKITGQLANGIAPVMMATGVGIPAGLALKGVGMASNAYASGERLAQHLEKPKRTLPINAIQAPKPEEAKPDIFY